MKLPAASVVYVACSVILYMFSSCNSNPYPGFTVSSNGLIYRIIKRSKENVKPKPGDILYMNVKYEAPDTVFFNSYTNGTTLMLKFPTAPYKGSIDEAFALMSRGDSAVMWTSADSFFVKVLKTDLPRKIKPGTKLYFTVTLKEVLTREKAEEQQRLMMAELENAAKENKEKEHELIKQYLKKNNITEKPRPSGLYIITKKKGKGKKVKSGNKVRVHYIGKFIDGKVFESSEERGEPIEFIAGIGNVIKGWDEALLTLQEGDKVTLIIPSNLAYGAMGVPSVIPPFTPLIFDVTLLKVSEE